MKIITIVKSKVDGYPRYRLIDGEVKSDNDLKIITKDTRVAYSFNTLAKFIVNNAINSGEEVKILKYDTEMNIPDPVHPEKDKKGNKDDK